MLKKRYLTSAILTDLAKKMVFIGGPRQVGKTTLARGLVAADYGETAYFNWDDPQARRRILAGDWPASAQLIILDEIHKHKGWKSLLKGAYDVHHERFRFLVTGSSRLDVYRRGGDSLQGRYHHYRLHPFSLAESTGVGPSVEAFSELPIPAAHAVQELAALETFGGFPEPLSAQDERGLRRWHNERNERLLREDIRDVELVREVDKLRLLSDMLPAKVGALLSVNALREDLQVSHRAASHWLDILEAFYYHFRLRPYARASFRSLKKEPKLYLWDWSEVPSEPARFENLVASHLLKFVHWLYDHEGHRAELRFLRDNSGREVDFLVVVDDKPWFAVEVKAQDESVSPHLRYFREKLKLPYCYQVLRKTGVDRLIDGVRVVSADRFLLSLV